MLLRTHSDSLFTLKIVAAAGMRPLVAALLISMGPGLLRFDVLTYLLALGVWTLAEACIEASSAPRIITAKSNIDLGSRAALLAVHLFGWIAPLPEIIISRRVPSVLFTAIGLLLIVTGAALRFAAHRALGASHTRALKIVEGQVLCRTGIYSVLRHPSYLGLILLNIAPCIAVQSPIMFFLMFVATFWSTAYRVRLEERALHAAWDHEYARYAAEVWAFVPGAVSSTRRVPP